MATIANILSLEVVVGAKCLHSFFRFSKYFQFSSLTSWCKSWDNSYAMCFISDIKFCFTSDEWSLYLNFVQVQNIIINVKDLVFTFIYAFVCYFCRFCLWLAGKLKIIENACLLIPLTYNLATWYSVASLTSVQ